MSNLIAPLRRPQEFGFKKGDHHLVVNAATKLAKCWAHSGLVIWEAPCLADGQHPNWKANSGDTPPGLYRIGDVYSDYRIMVQTQPMTEIWHPMVGPVSIWWIWRATKTETAGRELCCMGVVVPTVGPGHGHHGNR
jgi:hypothetical protein